MALYTKTGTFNAATSTGNQSVSWSPSASWPDGTVPKALIIWGVGTTTDGSWETAAFIEGIGFATSSTNQYAQSAAQSSTIARRRRMEACAFIQTNVTAGDIVRRADLVSMDSNGFTLDWTVARDDGRFKILGYAALAGTDLTGANVVNWQTPTSTGAKAVTGVGFTPDVAIHVHAGGLGALTDGGSAEGAASFGLGVMTPDGQWATGFLSQSTRYRNQESNKCLTIVGSDGTVAVQAQYASMDADGFTVNFGVAGAVSCQTISLCLQGGSWDARTITKSTTTGQQAVSGVGFTPSGLLLAGIQDVAQATPVTESVYGLGASDGTNSFATVLSADNTENYTTTSAVYVKNNPATSQDIDAVATLDSFGSDGYTLDWTTNDAVQTVIGSLVWGSAGETGDTGLSLTPDTATATAGAQDATLTGGMSLPPDTASATASANAATLGGGLGLSPDTAAATAAANDATLTGGLGLAATAATATADAQDATLIGGMSLTPTAAAATAAALDATIETTTSGLSLTPTAAAATASAPDATFAGGMALAASVATATAAAHDATIGSGMTLTATAATATAAGQDATFAGGMAVMVTAAALQAAALDALLHGYMRLGGIIRTQFDDPIEIDRTAFADPISATRTAGAEPIEADRTIPDDPVSITRTIPDDPASIARTEGALS